MEKRDLGLVARCLLAPAVLVVGAAVASMVWPSLMLNYVLAGGLMWLSGACARLAWVLPGRAKVEG